MARRLLFILFTFFCCSIKAQTVHFSIQAHADDWQLFMSSRIISDMTVANTKMVFITLTGGDGSAGAGSYGTSGIPFYLSRENGSVYSSKFAADLTTGSAPLDNPTVSAVTITTTSPVGSHTVWKYTYKNTVNYFLRLPDGNGAGEGFSANHLQSLQKLKSGAITAINVVGNTSNNPSSGPPLLTYTWSQLTATIRKIINDEKVTGTQSWIHAAHTITGAQTAYNTNDHSDHRYSSLAGQEAVASGMGWVGVNGFMDYNSSSQGANLSTTQHTNAAILFGLEVFGMTESHYESQFVTNHKDWLPMDYFQVIKTPSGNAPVARTNEEANDAVGTLKKESEGTESGSALTKIPMIMSVTSPAYVDKDITISISPYEAGQLSISVYDMAGNKVYDLVSTVKKRDALSVTLKSAVKTKGNYVLKSILNNRFTESWNITVE
ncbi:hypothetical protein [Ferruginibacter sp.]|nr:hypothetical protein [Ferruginibacter sp.]